MWDAFPHERVSRACSLDPMLCTPLMAAQRSGLQQSTHLSCALGCEGDEDENSNSSLNDVKRSQPLRLDKPLVRQIARPLFFPVCEITDPEEQTWTRPPLEMDNEELEMAHWCHTDADAQWLPFEEGDWSQPSGLVQLDEPGAPTKKPRGNEWHTSDSAYCQEENVSALMLCESSGPSHITVIEEAGESMDLPAHLSCLAVAPCTAQKKLTFAPAIEKDEGGSEEANGTCSVRNSGMQLLLGRKRFLEDRDANCGPAPPDALCTTTTSPKDIQQVKGIERKFRRVDNDSGTLQRPSPLTAMCRAGGKRMIERRCVSTVLHHEGNAVRSSTPEGY